MRYENFDGTIEELVRIKIKEIEEKENKYFCYILVWIFPLFWLLNLIYEGISKDIKKQLINNVLCMN